MRSPDRVLVLKPIEGTRGAKNTSGVIDTRLFTGDNQLHAIMNQQTSLWKLKYDQGTVPPPLQCEFTSFGKLKEYTEAYFKKRNIEIAEVKD